MLHPLGKDKNNNKCNVERWSQARWQKDTQQVVQDQRREDSFISKIPTRIFSRYNNESKGLTHSGSVFNSQITTAAALIWHLSPVERCIVQGTVKAISCANTNRIMVQT